MSISIFGIGWPGERPGFACLLELTGWTIQLHKETEADTLDGLVCDIARFIKDHRETYPVAGIVGRKVQGELNFLKEFNKDKLNPFLFFSEAPNVETTGRLTYHFNACLNVLRDENKRLFLRNDSKVLEYLESLSSPGAQDATDIQYPAVAALAYGVTYLLQRAGNPERRRRGRGYRDGGRATAWTA